MKKIVKYLNGSWPLIILAPLLMVLEVLCDLMQPTLMSDIIDIGVASGEMSQVWATGVKMLGVALLGIVGGAGCTMLSAKASYDSGARLRQGLFDKIQTFSFAEIDKLQTSSLITRLTNDITLLQNALRMMLCMLVRAPLSCIGGLVMAIAISPRLSLIFVAAIPVLACRSAWWRYALSRCLPRCSRRSTASTPSCAKTCWVCAWSRLLSGKTGSAPASKLPTRT